MLVAKLERYPWEIEQRNKVATRYNEEFRMLGKKGCRIPVVKKDRGSVWAQYTLSVPDRTKFQAALQEKGVPTAVHYPITMADQTAYKETSIAHDIQHARYAADRVVSLPIFSRHDRRGTRASDRRCRRLFLAKISLGFSRKNIKRSNNGHYS